ncbi:MAG: hypothetical protein BAJALOKI1v1_470007 [Promethearchaeota archaeon]|nr:MAG: hypothetical protein BAJALOKI1v1_470007 [Candidatus Lokiarchaeota archaeon]
MRTSRIIRWIIRIFILFLTLSMSAISILGGLSAVQILSGQDDTITGLSDPLDFTAASNNRNNIAFPYVLNLTNYGIPIEIDIEENVADALSGGNLSDLYFAIPFKIRNAGYFDLSEFLLGISISMVNATGANEVDIVHTSFVPFGYLFGAIGPGQSFIGTYNITTFQYSGTPTNPGLEFYIDVFFSATYSLDLITFDVLVFQYPLEGVF